MASFSQDHTPIRSPWEGSEKASDAASEIPASPDARQPSNDVAVNERRRRIAEAAYRRAQLRGFCPGYEVQDWLEAEQEIDAVATQQHWSESKFP